MYGIYSSFLIFLPVQGSNLERLKIVIVFEAVNMSFFFLHLCFSIFRDKAFLFLFRNLLKKTWCWRGPFLKNWEN